MHSSPVVKRLYPALLAALLCLWVTTGCDFAGGGAATPTVVSTPTTLPDASPTGTGDLPPGCLAKDMQGVAGWEGATGSLAGGIFVVNNGTAPCTLQGRPGVHILGADGAMLPITDVEAPGETTPCCAPVIVQPGSRAFVSFAWRNWCSQLGQAKGPFVLAVALPGDGGQLNVQVLDPSGNPLSDTPLCDAPNEASTIQVGRFKVPVGP